MSYFGKRYYDPLTGRWTGVDPEGQFFDGYGYGGSSPIVNVDPDGGSVTGAIILTVKVGLTLYGMYAAYRDIATSGSKDVYDGGVLVSEGGVEGAAFDPVVGGIVGRVLRFRAGRAKPKTGAYSDVPDPKNAGPGKPFTKTQKSKFLELNASRNNGVIRSDASGKPLVRPQKHVKGVTPPPNEAHVDHIKPRAKGGTNCSSNAQVLSREENLLKSDL